MQDKPASCNEATIQEECGLPGGEEVEACCVPVSVENIIGDEAGAELGDKEGAELRAEFTATAASTSSLEHKADGWPEVGGGGGARFPADNAKTVMCKNWTESGSCSYGDKCSFAHSEEQIRSSREQRIIALNPLYKTTLCKQFTEGEYCELGDNCHFAHGQDELRVVRADKVDHSADPLYKTVLCNKWEEVEGSCEYGDSCRFAHGEFGHISKQICSDLGF